MRTPLLVGIVVVVHCIAVGSILLIQGCGTTPIDRPEMIGEPVMMPPSVRVDQPANTDPSVLAVAVPAVGVSSRRTPMLAGGETYVVQKGDCLSSIAKKCNVRVADILALNKITNPNLIRRGQKLTLPGKAAVDAPDFTPKPAARPRIVISAVGGEYVVQKGDCLSMIANDRGIKTAVLREFNGLTDDKIYVGQKLSLPKGGTTAESQKTIKPPMAEIPDAIVAPIPVAGTIDEPEIILDDVPAPAQAVVDDSSAEFIPHTVEKGEDLYTIAMAYNASVASIRRLNGLSATEVVTPGQKLRIPVSQ